MDLHVPLEDLASAIERVTPGLGDPQKTKRRLTEAAAKRIRKRVQEQADYYIRGAGYSAASKAKYLEALNIQVRGDGSLEVQLRDPASSGQGFVTAMELGWRPPESGEWSDGLGKYDGQAHNMRPMLLRGSEDSRVIKMTTTATFSGLRERAVATAQREMGNILAGDHYHWRKRVEEGVVSRPPKMTQRRARAIGHQVATRLQQHGQVAHSRHAGAYTVLGRAAAMSGLAPGDADMIRHAERVLQQHGRWIGVRGNQLQNPSNLIKKSPFKTVVPTVPKRAALPRLKSSHVVSIFAKMGRTNTVRINGAKYNVYTVYRTITRYDDGSWYSVGFKPVGLLKLASFRQDVLQAVAEVLGR